MVIKRNGKFIAFTEDGRVFELTDDEAKFWKAVKRLENYKQGRLQLFGCGELQIRMDPGWAEDEIDYVRGIYCEGGDGGDYGKR
jgi:hypothetical protein